MAAAGFALPGVNPEPIDGDSLTKYLRASTNQTGSLLPQFLQQGANQFNSGQGILNQGVGNVNAATGFFSPLLNGNRAQMTNMLAPEIGQINQANQQKMNEIATLDPRGGGRNSALVQQEFAPLEQTNQLLQTIRPQAAGQMGALGQLLAQIGGQQQQQGLSQYGLGLECNNQLLQTLLGRRGQNVTESGQNKQLASSLTGDVIGGGVGLYNGR